MAGFDLENQRTAQLVGMKLNTGTFDFSSGSSTVDVPTTLSHAIMGMAHADLTATNDTQVTMLGYKVSDVSKGAVTFIRAGGFMDEDARMAYWLAGW